MCGAQGVEEGYRFYQDGYRDGVVRERTGGYSNPHVTNQRGAGVGRIGHV